MGTILFQGNPAPQFNVPHFFAEVANRGVGNVTSIMLSSITRAAQQEWNKVTPNAIPDIGSLLWCHWKGTINRFTLGNALAFHAVDLPLVPGQDKSPHQNMWDAVYESNKPVPNPDVARRLAAIGRISAKEYDTVLRRAGMFGSRWREAWRNDLYVLQSPGVYLEQYQRGMITLKELITRLNEHGYTNQPDINNMVDAAQSYLGPSFQVRYASWGITDSGIRKQWGLEQEMPGWWLDHCYAAGSNGQWFLAENDDASLPKFTFGQLQWWTHWATPSVGEAFSWKNRFRGDVFSPSTWSVPGVKPFTDDDFNHVLQINNVPPGARDWVKAGLRPLLSIRHIRMLLAYGVVDKVWVANWAQSFGYTPDDASKLADANYESVLAKQLDPLKTDARSTILKGYAAGWLSRDNAAGLLYPLVLTRPSDVVAFRQKSVDEQNRIGSASTVVSTALLQVDLEQKGVNLREWVRSIRSLYVRGQIDQSTAATRLRQLGMVADRIPDIVDRWNAARAGSTKEVSVSQLKRMVERGIVPLADYQYRLLQLNYSLSDIVRLTAEIGYDQQQSTLKQLAASARMQGQQQRAAMATARAAKAAHRQALSDLARSGSPAKLVDWSIRGILDEKTFKRRMRALDWPQDDIDHLWAEVQQRIAAKPVKQPKQPKPAKQPRTDGPTVSTLERWFTNGILTEADFRTRLGQLDWKAGDIDKAVQDALAKALAKKKTPRPPKPQVPKTPKQKELSKAELLKMFDDGVLGEQGLRDGLAELGYTTEDQSAIIIEELVKLGVALPGQ